MRGTGFRRILGAVEGWRARVTSMDTIVGSFFYFLIHNMYYFFNCFTSQVWRMDAYEGFTQEDLPESCCVKSEGKPVQKCHYKGFFTVRQLM